jgi:hypothetical protein
MGFAILSLISNTIVTSFACVGIATVINKVGKFFKITEEHKNDGFKAGFDSIMIDSIDELNKCVESLTIISSNIGKICIVMYDITVGNKFIKKDKNGKIIICNKSKLYSGYKDKIDELTNKVKKYENELKKMKHTDNNDKNTDNISENDKSEIQDDSSCSSSEKSYSDVSSDDEIIVEKDNNEPDSEDKEEFYLENE